MKAKDIVVGGRYIARVSGRFVTVQVNSIVLKTSFFQERYGVTNLDTGRNLVFRSAQKFRGVAEPVISGG